jgi:phage shock protein PspC (stress-responsive transcriptional regulator)
MARTHHQYSLNRRDKKLAGVCSTIGEVFNIDPTFIRIGFIAAAILISWKIALVGYVAAGIYLAVQRNRTVQSSRRRGLSDYDRMENAGSVRPSIKSMREDLDENDRRLMAIDHHINSQNDELAREIEALREDK